MIDKKTIGISIIMSLGLLLAGMNIDLDKSYYCEDRSLVMECARFSSSGLRCYPSMTSRKGYRDCDSGWMMVVNDTIVKNESEDQLLGDSFVCNPKYCVPKFDGLEGSS